MSLSLKNYSDLTLSQIMVAAQFILYKYVLSGVSASIFMCMRFGLTAVVLLFMRQLFIKEGVFEATHPTQRWMLKDTISIVAQGVLGGVLFNILLAYGLEYTTATSAGIIGSTLPAVIVILSFIFLKEKLTLAKFFAILLVMAGIAVLNIDNVSGNDLKSGSLFGDCLVFLAMIPEASYTIMVRYTKGRLSPSFSAMGVGVVCAVCFFIMAIIEGASWFALLEWTPAQWLALMGSVGTCVIFFTLWTRALKDVPANTAGLFGGVMPVASSLMAILCLGEHFRIYDFFGLVLVMGSIYLGTQSNLGRHFSSPK